MYRWVAQLGGEPDLTKPYAQHPWIYSCVAAIGRTASSVPVRFQRKLSDGEYETVEGSELGNLFNLPNPLQSRRKFFRAVATAQMLYGETFLLLLKKDKGGMMVPVDSVGGAEGMMAPIEEPEEIWPVRGDLVDALLDPDTKLPAMWRLHTATGHVDYPAHAVVQIAEVNPYNPLRGMGPMQAAYRTAAKDFVIDRYDEALLQNGGSPGGVLSVDGPLTDADQRAIRKAWEEAHGRPESNRKTAVLPKGTKYEEIGLSPAEMEHEKLRKWDRDTLLSIFGVPPVVLGLESMNYATSREQHRIFWENTITPYLDFVADELQYKFVNRIDSRESELKIDFDISGVAALREDVDAKVDRTVKLYQDGHRTFIEAARLSGWDLDENELSVSDERWIPSSLVPAGVAGFPSPDATVETPAEEVEDKEQSPGTLRDVGEVSGSDLEPVPGAEASSPWPPHLITEPMRYEYWKLYTLDEDETIEKLAKKTTRVYRDALLWTRRRLREIAAGGDWTPNDRRSAKDAEDAFPQIWTLAEVERLLGLDIYQWGKELSMALVPSLAEMMVQSAEGIAGEIGVTQLLVGVEDPFIAAFYREYPIYLAEGPTSTLARDVYKTILKTVAEAEVGSVASLSEAIFHTLKDQEIGVTHLLNKLQARSDRIARTETAKAHNGARVEEMKLNGVREHAWMSSRDGNVRDSHQIDGQTVIVGERFSNGVTYPGEGGTAPAQEVVNCRCTTVPVMKRPVAPPNNP
jgi:phage portal protein BeeE